MLLPRHFFILTLLVTLLSFACSGNEDENTNQNQSTQENQSNNDGDENTDEPEYDCITCDTLDCYYFCEGDVELTQPSPVHTCDEYPRFEASGDIFLHLDPTDYPNLYDIDGCNSTIGTPEFAFSLIAPEDGLLEFIFIYLDDTDIAPPFVHFDPVETGFNFCTGIANPTCPVVGSTSTINALSGYSREVIAGQEIPFILEVSSPTNLAILTEYILPQVSLGETCSKDYQCPALGLCSEDVCACSASSVIQNGACVCPPGTVPNASVTECISNPCATTPAPCDSDQTCSLDDENNPVCSTPEPIAQLGENCRDLPCAEGLHCETTTVCPFDGILHPICVQPCLIDSQCTAENIACSQTGIEIPACIEASNTGRFHCNWD